MDVDTLKQLDNLRRAHPTIPSRTDVIKRLIWDAHAKIPQYVWAPAGAINLKARQIAYVEPKPKMICLGVNARELVVKRGGTLRFHVQHGAAIGCLGTFNQAFLALPTHQSPRNKMIWPL
jgi:hypothetical protein